MMMGSARCSPDSCDYFVHRAVAQESLFADAGDKPRSMLRS